MNRKNVFINGTDEQYSIGEHGVITRHYTITRKGEIIYEDYVLQTPLETSIKRIAEQMHKRNNPKIKK